MIITDETDNNHNIEDLIFPSDIESWNGYILYCHCIWLTINNIHLPNTLVLFILKSKKQNKLFKIIDNKINRSNILKITIWNVTIWDYKFMDPFWRN